jgi:hypothetical protein
MALATLVAKLSRSFSVSTYCTPRDLAPSGYVVECAETCFDDCGKQSACSTSCRFFFFFSRGPVGFLAYFSRVVLSTGVQIAYEGGYLKVVHFCPQHKREVVMLEAKLDELPSCDDYVVGFASSGHAQAVFSKLQGIHTRRSASFLELSAEPSKPSVYASKVPPTVRVC